MKHKSLFLLLSLLSLVALLLVPAHLPHSLVGDAVLQVLYMAILGTSIRAISESRRALWVSVALALPFAFSVMRTLYRTGEPPDVTAYALMIPYWGFLMCMMLAYVLRREAVTTDKLYAVVCVYLLIGLTWASLYALTELFVPGSFYLSAQAETPGGPGFNTLIYYSFVTLTTLGYGDILPVSSAARSLAIIEATGGVAFTAILVARLVGLHAQAVSVR